MYRRIHALFLTFFLTAIALLSAAQAQVIGLNFIRGSDGMSPLAPADIAGVVAVGNWNNSTVDTANIGTAVPLVDATGTATSATADWLSGSASWSVATTGTGSAGDMLMMTGYLDQGGNGAGQVHSVTVSNIPYAAYDVYLYHSSAGGPNRTARYEANGAGIFTRNLDPAGTFDGFVKAGYATLAEAADFANPAGNYVHWESVTGTTLSILAQGFGDADGGAGGGTVRSPIQGIQIVESSSSLPALENLPATLIAVETATANGNLITNGDGADAAEVTIYWGTTDGGTVVLDWEGSESAGTFNEPGAFSANLTGLTANTVYYYRAYASNGAGERWAAFSESFTTLPAPALPEVETFAASDIALDSATANGNLLNNGAAANTATLTIYWGTSDGGTDTAMWEDNAAAGTLNAAGTFSADLTGLAQGTTYYYRAYASNDEGIDWAPTSESFITLRPSVATISMNFVRASNGVGEIARDDIAGVVPVANWNTATVTNANADTNVPLIDDGGSDSGATIDWQNTPTGNAWSVATAGAGSAGDMIMMTGYLDQTGDGLGQIHTITVNNIPYGTYDVYLYHSSAGGPNRTARYQANGTDLFTRNLDPANTFDGFVNAQYDTLDEAAVAGGNPAGNYVLWQGLSGTLNIEAEGLGDAEGGSGGNTRRSPIQGIQIVSASPPKPFAITSIDYDRISGKVTIVWNSEPDVGYAIEISTTLAEDWIELADFDATETVSTFEHTLPDNLLDPPNPVRLFYRIRPL